MWKNSILPDIYSSLPPLEENGWICESDGTYAIDWEAAKVQKIIQGTIDFLLKGCSCKKGCKSYLCDVTNERVTVVQGAYANAAQM